MAEPYSFGIEEEYFLIDAQTKSVARKMPETFLQEAKAATDGKVTGEMLQSQVEVLTAPHTDMAEARKELRDLRHKLAHVAGTHGLAILAAGTHPTAQWTRSKQSEGQRYDSVMQDLQMIGQRNMLCGLHVHVELPDPDQRVDVMTRMLPYVPLFIALATSSPFWQSRQTGLKGYRLAAYDELPRTGIPELFRSAEEFDSYIRALVRAEVIEDSSYIWWAIRPSLKNPTLELRAPDCCTRLEDALAVAGLYRTLARWLFRNPWVNWDLGPVERAIILENKWRAQRYGVDCSFVNIAGDGATSVEHLLDLVIGDTTHDAEMLGCTAELKRCRDIVTAGTSADIQLQVFQEHEREQKDSERALQAVTDWIAAVTLQ